MAAEKLDRGYLGRVLQLTVLASEIVEVILDRRQAKGAAPRMLIGPVPADWDGQRQSIRMMPEDVRPCPPMRAIPSRFRVPAWAAVPSKRGG